MPGRPGWPQLQCCPQRLGYTSDSPRPPFTVAWERFFTGERIAGWAQVVSDGRLGFIGTAHGVAHAFDLDTGKDVWSSKLDGPILQAGAVGNGRVFFATIGGSVFALEASTGRILWHHTEECGFSTAPLLVSAEEGAPRDAVYIGSRSGWFVALAQEDGAVLWRYAARGPILQTAAAEPASRGQLLRVFFGVDFSMDFVALDGRTGNELWRAGPLCGQSFCDFYPIVHRGKVMVRTLTTMGSVEITKIYPKSAELNAILRRYDQTWQSIIHDQQDAVLAWMSQHKPGLDYQKSCYVFDAATGGEPYQTAILSQGVNAGEPPPPVLGGDGMLYVSYGNQQVERSGADGLAVIAQFNMDTGRITDVLADTIGAGQGPSFVWGFDHQRNGQRFVSLHTTEPTTYAGGGMMLYGKHGHGHFAALDLATRQAWSVQPGPINLGAGNYASLTIVGNRILWVNMYSTGRIACIVGGG